MRKTLLKCRSVTSGSSDVGPRRFTEGESEVPYFAPVSIEVPPSSAHVAAYNYPFAFEGDYLWGFPQCDYVGEFAPGWGRVGKIIGPFMNWSDHSSGISSNGFSGSGISRRVVKPSVLNGRCQSARRSRVYRPGQVTVTHLDSTIQNWLLVHRPPAVGHAGALTSVMKGMIRSCMSRSGNVSSLYDDLSVHRDGAIGPLPEHHPSPEDELPDAIDDSLVALQDESLEVRPGTSFEARPGTSNEAQGGLVGSAAVPRSLQCILRGGTVKRGRGGFRPGAGRPKGSRNRSVYFGSTRRRTRTARVSLPLPPDSFFF
ncbi:uncharacterized protein LOC107046830 [Diachasma alloeum]|uniref:uncharacterized protein LOC107046830 n=1 Tax=Diachasma alloeum TaxID=454923 RepID=UPI00073822B8|nr:uncharacterized protein LOC107046830 [Diachasma alloeum]